MNRSSLAMLLGFALNAVLFLGSPAIKGATEIELAIRAGSQMMMVVAMVGAVTFWDDK